MTSSCVDSSRTTMESNESGERRKMPANDEVSFEWFNTFIIIILTALIGLVVLVMYRYFFQATTRQAMDADTHSQGDKTQRSGPKTVKQSDHRSVKSSTSNSEHPSSAAEVQDDDQEATVDLPTVEEMKAAFAAGGIEECRRLLERKRDAWKKVPLNVAVIGNAGGGKSSFVNAIRGLKKNDKRAAKVGVNQTTMEPRSYPHPDNPMLLFWDLPGVGTPKFPRATYLTDINVDRYDFFLLITATRFTENDIWLGEEFRKQNKDYFVVRTKIEQDVTSDGEAHPKTYSEEEEALVKEIRESTIKILREHGFDDVLVFLIDNHKPTKFDFDRLKLQLIKDFPERKKSALIFSLQAGSEPMIRLKVAELRSRISKLAALSATVGAIPIPGPSVVVDLAIVTVESMFYFEQLGLDDESLRRYADLYPVDYKRLTLMVRGALGLTAVGALSKDAMKAALLLFLRAAPTLASTSAKIGLRFLPVIGSLIAAPVSFGGTYASLTLVLNKFEQVAIDVMKCLTKSEANAQESGTTSETSGSEDGDQRSVSEEGQSAATVLDNVD